MSKNNMGGIFQDLQFGARVLRKNPGFTTVAVLSLALGIGANTAIFQLLNAVRLKTLPVNNAAQLVRVELKDSKGTRGNHSANYSAVTNPIWEKIRDRQQGFAGLTAWGTQTFNMAQGGEVRPARGLWVSGEFFNVLGVHAQQGRLFNASDDQRGCASPGVVLSNGFWQKEFGGNPDAIGRKISLADQQFEIVGITEPSFYGLEVGKAFERRGANLRGRFDIGKKQSARLRSELVVNGDRPAKAWLDHGASHRSTANHLSRDFSGNPACKLSASQRQ
jgi:hypothetical protein